MRFVCTRLSPISTGHVPYQEYRQKYYIEAIAASEALDKMREQFPNDPKGFTVDHYFAHKSQYVP